ncbi:hypothetical protein Pmani_020243 [Petrolisthes manimaculis]|uniref:Uncharacterized protein n=1 Tax=Petrolisthes manimaculis TaxID=1843537 RepID=A0AAE1PIT7_9EUCA|nr:hypothetical protein Pmani_020243 [Petrolisthes manimaculis]
MVATPKSLTSLNIRIETHIPILGRKLGMADIHVQSELIQGPVRVAVLETDLPIPGVTFLLGNDLAGHGMIPDVVVSEKPVNESPTAKFDQEKPHLFPVCVVTRSQTVSEAIDSPSLSHRDTLFSQVMNRENLIRAQEEDPSLAKLGHIADDKSINAIPEPGLTQNGELCGETEVVDFPSPSGNPKNNGGRTSYCQRHITRVGEVDLHQVQSAA